MAKPEQEADKLLEEFQCTRPPIAVEDIARGLGIQVNLDAVSPHISGLMFRDEDRQVIGINGRNSSQRQRFTIAHELGHLRLRHKGELILDTNARLHWRDERSSMATSSDEIEANRFAAHLLMPTKMVLMEWADVTSHQRGNTESLIKEMSSIFDVSVQAMTYRLQNLGLLMPT